MDPQPPGAPGRVLLASVSNIKYPVDLDLIHHLFSRFGEVEKVSCSSSSSSSSSSGRGRGRGVPRVAH
ncbi:polypyrimidine track-binding protein, putative [Eimeria tenella]|uniref:Polypyrimidine track-binding protein, putative n=1 Tax=Eimeria tenella TaxID=5802 RepID=U6KMX7_EIMTE|nr:polypyrimidine track-binding protein, putative [Eimeria tenella]CDJ38181.1 polypyrimidine track-binding protein, putative [Eimeria tenella]|eukprot:XP_013229019.1 polypyrimidine track-binding protein, putative [Eimeria tenella]